MLTEEEEKSLMYGIRPPFRHRGMVGAAVAA